MLTEKIKELEAAKAKVSDLEQKILADRPSELASLPARYGFTTVKEFLAAVKEAVQSGGGKAKLGRQAKVAKTTTRKVRKSRGRKRITDETRAQVKTLVEAGKSGSSIAKELGISLPSVGNIKKALGLVKTRKAKAPKVETPVIENISTATTPVGATNVS